MTKAPWMEDTAEIVQEMRDGDGRLKEITVLEMRYWTGSVNGKVVAFEGWPSDKALFLALARLDFELEPPQHDAHVETFVTDADEWFRCWWSRRDA
jgi:hypothetical protein